MEARDINVSLLAYETEACAENLAELYISLCMHTDVEKYTDGDILDLVSEVCDSVRSSQHHKVRGILEESGVIKPGGEE